MAHALHFIGAWQTVGALLIPGYLLLAGFWLTGADPNHYGTALGGLLGRNERNANANTAPAPRSFWHELMRAVPAGARELVVALGVCAVVFPLYVLGWYIWMRPATPFELRLHPELADFVATQILIVALSEEAFFRGFLQTSLSDLEKRRVRVLGVELAPVSWLAQAALFALVHVIGNGEPARLAVFFPGLLFGWMRAWRGGIGAAVFFHALCNIWSDLLTRSWLL